MSLGEKFAGFKEKISAKIEQIGKKKFAVIIAAVLVAIALLAYFLFFFAPVEIVEEVQISFKFVDELNQPLQNIKIEYSIAEQWFEAETDLQGMISFSVPVGSDVTIHVEEFSVNGRNFKEFEQDFFIAAPVTETVMLYEKVVFPKYKSVIFQSSDGILGEEEIIASFACTAIEQSWSEKNTVSTSVITTEVPENCGNLSVDIECESFEPASLILLAEEKEKSVTLTKKQVSPGKVSVTVYEDGKILTAASMLVTLYGEEGQEYEKFTGEYGSANFDVTPGFYTITVSDPNNIYTSANGEVGVKSNGKYFKDISVSKSPKGTITVKVIDKDNKQEIENAEVILNDAKGKIYAKSSTGDAGESVEFIVTDVQEYSVIAKKEGDIGEGYFPSEEVKITEIELTENPEIEIELEKITEFNTGLVRVRVLDDDALPVKNAFVQFMVAGKEEDGSLDYLLETSVPYNDKWTDANGIVEFALGKVDKAIYPYVTKGAFESKQRELAKEIKLQEENEFNVMLEIGKSTVNLTVVNLENGELVSGARYEVFKFNGEKLIKGEKTLSEGSDSLTLKALGKVYFKIKHENFTTVFTRPVQLWPDETYDVKVEMRPLYVGKDSKVEFVKVMDAAGEEVQVMHFNKEYSVLFRVLFPSEDFVEEEIIKGGMHFRVGDSFTLENEPIKILGNGNTQIEAAGDFSVQRGKTYDITHDGEEEIVEGEAKWVNLYWNYPTEGNAVEYIVSVQVMPTVPEAHLPMYYRGWAVTYSEKYLRDPVDEELGTAESSALKNALYANTKSILNFFEGYPLECPGQEHFCWVKEYLKGHFPGTEYDLQFEYSPTGYDITNFSEYDFNFGIQSIGTELFQELTLVIESEEEGDLKILSYTLENADAEKISSSNVTDPYRVEFSDLGKFTYSKEVHFSMKFAPQKQKSTKFKVTIIGDDKIIFEHAVEFKVLAENEMKIVILDPPEEELLPAHIFYVLEAEVRDLAGNYLLDDVLVRAELDFEDTPVNQLIEEKTIAAGEKSIQFPIPEVEPGTTVILNAFKENYAEAYKEVKVDDKIIEWKPEQLSFELDTKANTEASEELTFKNKTGIEFVITDAWLSGHFYGVLNEEKIANALKQQLPLTIPVEEEGMPPKTLEIPIFLNDSEVVEAILMEEFDGQKTFGEDEGVKLFFNLEQVAGLGEYEKEVPIQITVGLGEKPKEACVELYSITEGFTLDEWQQSLQGYNSAELEFEIKNHCTVGGGETGIDLPGMRFEVDEISKLYGNLEVLIQDPEGFKASDSLVHGKGVELILPHGIENFEETDRVYYGKITYTPMPGFKGKKSDFTIKPYGLVVSAEEEGYGKIDAYPSKIRGEILNINLVECISFDDEIEFSSDAEGEITVTNNCLFTPVEIYLCRDDKGCSGGTSKGELVLSDNKFDLKGPTAEEGLGEEEKITIELKKFEETVLGLYGIRVEARPIYSQSWQYIGEIEVQVNPSNEWMFLNKYDLDGFDSKEYSESKLSLINRAFLQDFSIRTDSCTWEDYSDKKHYWQWDDWLTADTLVSIMDEGEGMVAALSVFSPIIIVMLALGFAAKLIFTVLDTLFFGLWSWLLGCDEDNYYTHSGYMDYIIKLGNQQPQGVESDFQECEIEALDWQSSCYQHCCDSEAIETLEENEIKVKECSETSCSKPANNELLVEFNWLGHAQTASEEGALTGPEYMAAIQSQYERIGINFKKGQDLGVKKAEYGLLSVKAHYDRIADVLNCKNANFYLFKVGTSSGKGKCRSTEIDSGTKEFNFHLRFNAPEPPLQMYVPEIDRCEGIRNGFTGPDHLPRVRFNWDWTGSTEEDHITWNSCDASKVDEEGNPAYIYCDATQFSIMVSKRLAMLKEFLEVNDYYFECPEDWMDLAEQQGLFKFNEEHANRAVPNGEIGLSELKIAQQGDTFIVTATVTNNTNKTYKDVNIEFIVKTANKNSFRETAIIPEVKQAEQQSLEQSFEIAEQGIHSFVARILKPSEIASTQETSLAAQEKYKIEKPEECWLDYSTALTGYFVSNLEFFINPKLPDVMGDSVNESEESINWPTTAEWPEAQAEFDEKMAFLRNLLVFDVYLIKDNYTEDFQKDFAHYYTTIAFADVPEHFTGTESLGGFADYFNNRSRFEFALGGITDTKAKRKLPVPGKYLVNLAAEFDKSKGWKFFDGKEAPAKIKISLSKIQAQKEQLPFYYLPFDGEVGIDTIDGRQEYGIDYDAKALGEEEIYLADEAKLEKISDFSDPLVKMTLEKRTDLDSLNSRPSTRGNLLAVGMPKETLSSLVFSPNNFSPTIMQITSETYSEEPFSVEYRLLEVEEPVNTGANLTYWRGLGPCRSFTGKPIFEEFSLSPDFSSEENYAIEFDNQVMDGNAYLSTIFYLPKDKRYALKSYSNEVKFIHKKNNKFDPNEEVTVSGKEIANVNYLSTVFDLVKERKVCVTITSDNEMHFWWSPKYILEEYGADEKNILNVKEFEDLLKPEETDDKFECIYQAG